ncbi:MAG: DUF5656 family protein, partial [Anaerolineales bacterium]
EVNSRSVMVLLATALAVSGGDSVVRAHPAAGRGLGQAWIVPGLAALAFGDALARIPLSAGWWFGLAVATATVLAAIALEFVLVDPSDPRTQPAVAALSGVALLALAAFFFDLRASGSRAVFLTPLVFAASAAVVGRVLAAGPSGWPGARYPLAVGAIAGQLAFALHYWPLHPIQFALLLTLSAYLGLVFVRELRAGDLRPGTALELGGLAAGVFGLVLLLG